MKMSGDSKNSKRYSFLATEAVESFMDDWVKKSPFNQSEIINISLTLFEFLCNDKIKDDVIKIIQTRLTEVIAEDDNNISKEEIYSLLCFLKFNRMFMDQKGT